MDHLKWSFSVAQFQSRLGIAPQSLALDHRALALRVVSPRPLQVGREVHARGSQMANHAENFVKRIAIQDVFLTVVSSSPFM